MTLCPSDQWILRRPRVPAVRTPYFEIYRILLALFPVPVQGTSRAPRNPPLSLPQRRVKSPTIRDLSVYRVNAHTPARYVSLACNHSSMQLLAAGAVRHGLPASAMSSSSSGSPWCAKWHVPAASDFRGGAEKESGGEGEGGADVVASYLATYALVFANLSCVAEELGAEMGLVNGPKGMSWERHANFLKWIKGKRPGPPRKAAKVWIGYESILS
ncbi:hypothetical protein GQ53DRAFT_496365 [Thozetella sp. PMI_491]|nr:hypothetical protein GQ53DRAFT_496365 [Thozetella sp. PMI_491]